jgi:hypothetical protein
VRRVVLALVLLAALTAAASADARTYFPNCATHLRFKPGTISVFCADGGLRVKRLHWYEWGASEARGRSSHASLNDCKPTCAQGHFHTFHARLVLHRARTCSRNDKRIFTRMTVIFTGEKKPSGPGKFTQRLFCET